MPCARLWSSSSPQTLTRTLTEDSSSSALPSELVLLPETSLGLQPGEDTSHWLHAPLSILETPSLYSQGSAHDLPLVQFLISGLQWSSCARTQGSALNSTDKVFFCLCQEECVQKLLPEGRAYLDTQKSIWEGRGLGVGVHKASTSGMGTLAEPVCWGMCCTSQGERTCQNFLYEYVRTHTSKVCMLCCFCPVFTERRAGGLLDILLGPHSPANCSTHSAQVLTGFGN